MNRRDALKSLAAIAGATGISVTPMATQDVAEIEMVLIHVQGLLSHEQAARLKAYWEMACVGTSFQGTKTVVLERGTRIEFVKRRT